MAQPVNSCAIGISPRHTIYSPLPADIWEGAAALGEQARPEGVNGTAFRTLPPAGADDTATHLEVHNLSLSAEWFYDAELRQYLRFTDGEEHGDSLTGEQLAVENVLMVYAYHELSDIVEDVWNGAVSYGHRISLLPEGELLLFRDGQVYFGRWLRSHAGGAIAFRRRAKQRAIPQARRYLDPYRQDIATNATGYRMGALG